MISPENSGPLPVNNPCFAPTNVTVRSAFIAKVETAPVLLHKPEGISIDSIGRNEPFMRSMACIKLFFRSPLNPVPINPSTMNPSERSHEELNSRNSADPSIHIDRALRVASDILCACPNSYIWTGIFFSAAIAAKT